MVRDRRRQHLLLADENLISFVGRGDAEAFTVLYDRHGRAAFSLAYSLWASARLPRTSSRTPS
jgi:hypothetical protein